jgi:hypothetical protein
VLHPFLRPIPDFLPHHVDKFLYLLAITYSPLKTQPLREEKNCLNCGTDVPGRYCTNCGQENIIPHETFPHLVKHFVADIVHYDSKTLLTFKYLFLKPGFLTKEYTAGKRLSYVNPIRLYIFCSFFFFLFFFTLTATHKEPEKQYDVPTREARNEVKDDVLPDSLKQTNLSELNWGRRLLYFRSKKEYDSLQRTLAKEEQDNMVQRAAAAYFYKSMEKEFGDGEEETDANEELFRHNYPKIMFVLLPLFALYLRWTYNRKKWLYSDHAIFSIHIHTFFFILYLFCLTLDKLFHTQSFSAWGLLGIFAYLVLALKNTYGQSYGKAIGKGIILTMAYVVTLGVVFVGFYMIMGALFLS